LRACRDAGRAEPPAPPNHFALALYFQRIADDDNALTHYRALLEENDTSAEVHDNLGVTFMRSNRAAAAVAEFRVALSAEPGNAPKRFEG
jgi:Tfp pilus assembly protein PilF